jgi:hypothetical protein
MGGAAGGRELGEGGGAASRRGEGVPPWCAGAGGAQGPGLAWRRGAVGWKACTRRRPTGRLWRERVWTWESGGSDGLSGTTVPGVVVHAWAVRRGYRSRTELPWAGLEDGVATCGVPTRYICPPGGSYQSAPRGRQRTPRRSLGGLHACRRRRCDRGLAQVVYRSRQVSRGPPIPGGAILPGARSSRGRSYRGRLPPGGTHTRDGHAPGAMAPKPSPGAKRLLSRAQGPFQPG